MNQLLNLLIVNLHLLNPFLLHVLKLHVHLLIIWNLSMTFVNYLCKFRKSTIRKF